MAHAKKKKIWCVHFMLGVSGLWMVESVDSIKLAHLLNKHWGLDDRDEKLNVMVQVNTNREEGNVYILSKIFNW